LKSNHIIFFLIGVAALGVGIYIAAQSSFQKRVKTAPVIEGKAIEAVYATAVVEPLAWSAIAPVRTGRIVDVLVEEGDSVEEGQILARMDDADMKKQYDEYRALEELQMTELERAQKLKEKDFAAQALVDKRGADLSQTMSALKRIKEEMRQLSLYAPRAGIVLWRDVEPGEVRQAGQTVFWVGMSRPLRLKAEVDEEDIPKVKPEQKVLITADAFPGEVLKGNVDRISPKGDPVNKSYRVYMALPEDTKLMIGMTVETNTIVQEKERALLVPAEAVSQGAQVWQAVRENDRLTAHKVSVTTGITGKEQTEILSGLKAGDSIILPPFDGLNDGDIVQAE